MMTVATAQLTYDASRELLSGKIGGELPFLTTAYSGGSRGHKVISPKLAAEYLHQDANSLTSRLATTGEKKDSHGHYIQRGGTLPPGHYDCRYVAHHAHFGECIQLLRRQDALAIHSPFSPHPIPHLRHNDFFIHGAGPKGSDGCIVVVSLHERRRLNRAVKDFAGNVVLLVQNVSYMLPAELEGQFA